VGQEYGTGMAEALKFIGDLPRLSSVARSTRDEEYQFSPDGTLLLVWRTYPWSEGPAGQVLLVETGECLSMISPRMNPAELQQHWMLYEVAWEETGLHRLALWWRFEGTETHEVEGQDPVVYRLDESVIQVFDARSGEYLWAMEAGWGRTSFSSSRHLHLFGDTLRVIDEKLILQKHRNGLASYWESSGPGEMTLADGSGEVLQYTELPPVEGVFPLVSPSGRHVIFGARLYEITDRPRDPVALPSLYVPPARRMIPNSQDFLREEVPSEVNLSDPDWPPKVGVLPDWTPAVGGEQPDETHMAAEPLTCTLDDVRSVLETQGWPISGIGAWRTAWERPRSVVVAEVLERLEGAVAFMTAWRNLWPVRWKVPLQGSAEAAARQITQALLTGHDRLNGMPLARPPSQGAEQSVFSRSLEDLRKLQRTLNGEEAALASVALSRLLWDGASVLPALPRPPEPDWNLVRLFWYEGSLPLWVLRQLWTWMPADVRTELREDLEDGDHDLDLEFGAWLANERERQLLEQQNHQGRERASPSDGEFDEWGR
jgi:hypothetical protein